MDDLIEKYIALRDAKGKLKAQYVERAAKIDGYMDAIEGHILAAFKETGVESARCSAGTAYKSVRTSATVADWDAILDYIKNHNLWNMLDKRVNKTAVDEFRKEHDDLPPGVNYSEEVTLNIRRS